MNVSDFQFVRRRVASGAKIAIGRNPAGRMRLRLRIGPFGLFTKRFDLTDDEFIQLKKLMAQHATIRNPHYSAQARANA